MSKANRERGHKEEKRRSSALTWLLLFLTLGAGALMGTGQPQWAIACLILAAYIGAWLLRPWVAINRFKAPYFAIAFVAITACGAYAIFAVADREPEILFAFSPSMIKPPPGTQVDGITWREEYRRHLFKVINTQGSSIVDGDINLYLPGFVRHYIVVTRKFVESVDLESRRSIAVGGVASDDGMIPGLTNVLNIHITQLRPLGSFVVSIITGLGTNEPGTLVVHTSHDYWGKNILDERTGYPIQAVADSDGWELQLDTSQPMRGSNFKISVLSLGGRIPEMKPGQELKLETEIIFP